MWSGYCDPLEQRFWTPADEPISRTGPDDKRTIFVAI
jgi:hypothetical protein